MSGPFRNTDAVLTIEQNNARHAIEITAANEVAGNIMGLQPADLKGKPLYDFLPEKITELLNDYVEFESGANDVGDVLRKVRDFQLLDKDGKPKSFRLKIIRHHSQENDGFLLVLHDEQQQKETSSFMQMLNENFQGHESLDENTGLPDRTSFVKGLELVSLHLENIPQGVSMAMVQLDQYEEILAKYGINACNKLVQNIAALCRQNLRGNDRVMQTARNQLGLLLIGTQKEPAKIVLNRLRWLIGGLQTRTEQGVDVHSTATIFFKEILKHETPDSILAACEKKMEDKPDSSMNLVVDV